MADSRKVLSLLFGGAAAVSGAAGLIVVATFLVGLIEFNPGRWIVKLFSDKPYPTLVTANSMLEWAGLFMVHVVGAMIWGFGFNVITAFLQELRDFYSCKTYSEFKAKKEEARQLLLQDRQLGSVKAVQFIDGGMLIETDRSIYKVRGRHCHIPNNSIVWLNDSDLMIGQDLFVKSPDGVVKKFDYVGSGMV